MRIKDIEELKQKDEVTGIEKIPVSVDEYVTIGQINEEGKKDTAEALQGYVKKTDVLIINGGIPSDLKNND